MVLNRWRKGFVIFLSVHFLLFGVLSFEAYARVGGGRSMGSRGSRSSTPPRSYTPQQPGQQQMKEAVPPPRPGQPSPPPQGGFLRGLGGGILGGLIGGMLFRSLGFGATGPGSGGGVGLFDILLLGLLVYGIFWFVRRRRQQALAGGYYQTSAETVEPAYQLPNSSPPQETGREDWDLEKGLSHIRQMDPTFDERKLQDLSMDYFFRIQGAWANNDVSGVRSLMTPELYHIVEDDIAKLKMENRVNKLENIAVRSVDFVEAWQESGSDFITVRVYANLLDYTVDEKSGQVVSGSKTEPVKFVEYWTFTRPVGNHPWQLSAINQNE